MARFAPNANIHTVTGKANSFVLTKQVSFYSSKYDYWTHAPIGFSTDFASLPKFARVFINRNGKSRAAAVIHDRLCVTQEVNRKRADQIFLEALGVCGVRWPVRWAMYSAVRAYGRVLTTTRAIRKRLGK